MGMLALADALPMPIAFLDRDRRYRFINQRLADFFERPRSDILGRSVARAAGRGRLCGPQADDRRRASPASGSGSPPISRTRPAGPLAIQAEYVPQIAPDGAVQGIVALITDVTEQRVAERALRESEERFRRIANSAPAMMWVTRLDRTRDFVNDAYVEFAGLSREQAQQLDWRTRIHPDDVDRIVAESIAGEAARQAVHARGALSAA